MSASLIASLKATQSAALAERNSHATALAELRGQQQAGGHPTADVVNFHRREKERLDAECDERAENIARFEAEQVRAGNADRLTARINRGKPAYDQVARVGSEARTYRPDEDPTGKGFLLDISRSFIFGDPSAQERLQRHAAEDRVEHSAYMSRAVGTGAYAGLTVPQYLTDNYAPQIANLRPFADSCTTKHTIPPEGMTLNISRVTTGTSVALQSSENSAVSETNMDDTLLTINVQTAAGQQTVSRQAIERGTGIEDVTIDDLMRKHASTLDSTLLNQATNGLTNVAQSFTYVDASPTVPELWPKLFQAQNGVEAALLGQAPPSHFVMHPRRWNWICSQTSSTWPVAGGVIPTQLFAQVMTNEYGAGVRAVMSNGMLVVTDANITTTAGAGTEDEIYCVAQGESHLWEDPAAPLFIRAEQPAAASLGVLLVVYSYFSYTHARYTNAASKISGTGLIAPTF